MAMITSRTWSLAIHLHYVLVNTIYLDVCERSLSCCCKESRFVFPEAPSESDGCQAGRIKSFIAPTKSVFVFFKKKAKTSNKFGRQGINRYRLCHFSHLFHYKVLPDRQCVKIEFFWPN